MLEAAVVIALVGLAAIAAALVVLSRLRRPPAAPPERLPSIAVSSLPPDGPPAQGPGLECYGIPVRLAVLVLAPLGRTPFPEHNELLALLDQTVPGLSLVFDAHQTKVHRWDPQFSPRGFANFISGQARLPRQGIASPWCLVSGRLDLADGALMVGMLLCADQPQRLGQIVLDRTGQWLEVLRVRQERQPQ